MSLTFKAIDIFKENYRQAWYSPTATISAFGGDREGLKPSLACTVSSRPSRATYVARFSLKAKEG